MLLWTGEVGLDGLAGSGPVEGFPFFIFFLCFVLHFMFKLFFVKLHFVKLGDLDQ